ncbi:MAG TPA: FtsX-like permease family protein, partial [Vicinamibacterales bacterium]
RRLRGVLVAGQVALAIALLAEVGSMARAAIALRNAPKGFDARNLLSLRIDLPEAAYPDPARVRTFFDALTSRVAALPGVRAVGAADWLPILHRERTIHFTIDSLAAPAPGSEPWAAMTSVTPGYRRAMDIPFVSGRDLAPTDTVDAPPVVLVSRTAVQRYWNGVNPVGQHIRLIETGSRFPEPEIVGVVGDVWTGNRDAPVIPQIYAAGAQRPQRAMTVMVRGDGDAAALTPFVRTTVLALDKDLPIYDVSTMEQILADDMVEMYIVIGLLVALALIAVGLAAAGIYGVVAYAVSERTHEIGVRMALGARAVAVQRMIVRQALVPVAIGGAIGLAIGFGLVQTTAAAMRETPRDSFTYAAVIAVVGTVALAASYFPARRASRIDPISALRAE